MLDAPQGYIINSTAALNNLGFRIKTHGRMWGFDIPSYINSLKKYTYIFTCGSSVLIIKFNFIKMFLLRILI